MALDSARKQPPWIAPQPRHDVQLPALKIYNSLTRTKNNFVPVDPTDAHLGHAKNYVSTDIIRPIMKDYFGFRVKFVMNTTDIDDKIIVSGRQQYLLARFKEDHSVEGATMMNDAILSQTRAAFQHYITKNLPSIPSDTSPEAFSDLVARVYKDKQGEPVTVDDLLLRARVGTARLAAEALQAPGSPVDFFSKTDDILLPYLDVLHGASMDSNKNDKSLQDDGEGSLSKGTSMKWSDSHFALWKASKPGEPAWPNPWGQGRPGWHIECSAMASDVIGKTIDIHSGGVDLHSLTMITSSASPRLTGQLRTAMTEFEVTEDLMKAVVGWEGKLNNFFLKALDIWKHSSDTTATPQLSAADHQLLNSLEKAKADVDTALCDLFNTSAVMRILSELVTKANSAESLSNRTMILLARWVTRIVSIFGLDPEGSLQDTARIGWSGLEIPLSAKPYIYPASQLRDQVRSLACSGFFDHASISKLAGEIPESSALVDETSKSYSDVLLHFRAELEDRNSPRPALVRPLDKSIVEARAERETAGAAKAKAKLEQEAKEADAAKELLERAKVDPAVMFHNTDEYSEWDENGIPTIEVGNKTVSKNKRKKLVKEWEKEKKRHEEWLATQN
ncbi:hypothetical protein QBC38DRAFT_515729 [Podospora fimiseda]|uniref:tRNA synthetases class I catalytic domain-containing protein n=1 Tax=Podospora fimiseda TaxID=252190 RepID=A0AAN7BIW0_9PEZI|nr:hypothetical protein QBC38DRAFT_515729 [Podospora fimiseda]